MNSKLVVYPLLLCLPALVSAQIIAQDNAGNYDPGTWVDSSNQGTGFEEWRLTTTGVGGNFLGNAGNLGSNTGVINTDDQSFGIWANDTSDAFRDFSQPLSVGDVFTFDVAFRFTSGNRGFDLRSGGGTVFNLNINDGGFFWTGGNSLPLSDWEGNRENGMVISTTITATATGFDYAFSSPQDAALSAESGSVASSPLNEVVFYVNNTLGGGDNDFFFNNLEIVPEPGTFMLLLGGLGMLAYLRRRRG